MAKNKEALAREKERLTAELATQKERLSNALKYQEELERRNDSADTRIAELSVELEVRTVLMLHHAVFSRAFP